MCDIFRLAQKIVQEFPDKKIEIFSFQDSIDLKRCEQLKKAIELLSTNMIVSIHKELSDDEVIEKISKAEYLLAMRFHAIIIGLLSATKTLAINYDIKIPSCNPNQTTSLSLLPFLFLFCFN